MDFRSHFCPIFQRAVTVGNELVTFGKALRSPSLSVPGCHPIKTEIAKVVPISIDQSRYARTWSLEEDAELFAPTVGFPSFFQYKLEMEYLKRIKIR